MCKQLVNSARAAVLKRTLPGWLSATQRWQMYSQAPGYMIGVLIHRFSTEQARLPTGVRSAASVAMAPFIRVSIHHCEGPKKEALGKRIVVTFEDAA